MVDRVAHQVEQRLADLVEQPALDQRAAVVDPDPQLLAVVARELERVLAELGQRRVDRRQPQRPRRRHDLVEVGAQPLDVVHGVARGRPAWLRSEAWIRPRSACSADSRSQTASTSCALTWIQREGSLGAAAVRFTAGCRPRRPAVGATAGACHGRAGLGR